MDEVTLLYSADQWLSCSSMKLIAVCSSKNIAIDLAVEHAKEKFCCISVESLGENENKDDDTDYIEDIVHRISYYGQFNGHGFGYYTETVKMDVLQ